MDKFLKRSYFLSLLITLVPEAIYRGSEERSESPLVESVGNLTSMLSQEQKLNLDNDGLPRSESPLVESVGNLTSMLSQEQKLNLDNDWLTYSLSFAPRPLYKSPLEPG